MINIKNTESKMILNPRLTENALQKRKEQKKSEVVGVRLSEESSNELELIALKFNKSRGITAKVLLENAIFQICGEHRLLSEEKQKEFDTLMQIERNRFEQKIKDKM